MPLKIFHTGDVHLGMKFNNYGDMIKESLVEARFLSLENMIEKSNELNCDLFVVAGDLFNTIQVAKRDVDRTVNILNKFNGACVLVLPGNHDYDNGVVDLWNDFSKFSSEKILILNEKRSYCLKDYDLDVVAYPAHCHSKHSKENSLEWLKTEGICESGRYHIGIAHGALEGLSADIEGNYYSMSMDELHSIPTDVWLIGHTHVRYPLQDEISNHKVFNPGTPEPDGLDFKHDGSAWYITLDDGGNIAKRIVTGQYRFFDKQFEINSDEDLESIKSWALEGEVDKKIIRISLKGSISKEAYESLNVFYRNLESKVFHFIVDDSQLRVKINKDTIEEEFVKGSFPYEFLNGLTHDEEALQIAYDLLRRE